MTTTVNATLPQDDTYVKMVEYATNLKLTAGRVGKAGGDSHLYKFSSYKCYIFKSSILNLNH